MQLPKVYFSGARDVILHSQVASLSHKQGQLGRALLFFPSEQGALHSSQDEPSLTHNRNPEVGLEHIDHEQMLRIAVKDIQSCQPLR